MRNIFLTGPVNAGKSTVINTVISKLGPYGIRVSGFYTLPYIRDGKHEGFFMEPFNFTGPVPDRGKRLIARAAGKKWIPEIETFEELGVRVLDESLRNPSKLVIMDELGFFEARAENFQSKVMDLIGSSKLVLGVIKPVPLAFLDGIRNREDVDVFEVTASNRGYLGQEILSILRTEMGLWDFRGPSKT
jgi:nucleoside-triphosphatase